jgi:hypothetical protein
VGDLMVGLAYLVRFAGWAGAVTAAEADALLVRGRAALAALVADQADHLQAGDPVDQFLRLVPAVLLSGQAHLSAPAGGPPDRPDGSGWRRDGDGWTARGNRIGWADGDAIYLDPDATYAEVQRLAVTQREPVTMSPRTLWKRLHERKLLTKVDTRGGRVRFAARATLGGERVDVLHVHRRTLFPDGAGGPGGPPAGRAPGGGDPGCGVSRDVPGPRNRSRTGFPDGGDTALTGSGHTGHSPGPEGPGDVEEFAP